MNSFRTNPILTAVTIAVLLGAQLVNIPHGHAGLDGSNSEHASKPHVHVGSLASHSHGHEHEHEHGRGQAHGHAHSAMHGKARSHVHGCSHHVHQVHRVPQLANKRCLKAASYQAQSSTADHDSDAFYFSGGTLAVTTQAGMVKKQVVSVLLHPWCDPLCSSVGCFDSAGLRPPDPGAAPANPLHIFWLKQAVLC